MRWIRSRPTLTTIRRPVPPRNCENAVPPATTLACGAIAPSYATTVAPLTVEQVTDASDLIIRGEVEDMWVDPDASGHLYTRVLVRVTNVLKGSVAVDDYVTVESAGGTLDGQTMIVDGTPRYSVGEDALLFLTDKPSRGVYGTVGLNLGKYTVRPDPRNGTPLVVQFVVKPEQTYDARFIPVPPVDQRVTLGTLESRVRARVTVGWDGKPIPGISNERLRAINTVQPGVR